MWKLKTHWLVDGPHIIHGKHYPQNPRVALLHNNVIYLIRNRLIYRLDEFDYDKELEINTIDTILNPPPDEYIRSGFTYSKRHYIFTKKHVYVYDSTHGNLLSGYPKPLVNGWFACETASRVPKLNKKSSTMRPLPTKPSRKPGHDEVDDYSQHHHRDRHHGDHHHGDHHHDHHRPRRPHHHHHHDHHNDD
jgi:hypothetical protein